MECLPVLCVLLIEHHWTSKILEWIALGHRSSKLAGRHLVNVEMVFDQAFRLKPKSQRLEPHDLQSGQQETSSVNALGYMKMGRWRNWWLRRFIAESQSTPKKWNGFTLESCEKDQWLARSLTPGAMMIHTHMVSDVSSHKSQRQKSHLSSKVRSIESGCSIPRSVLYWYCIVQYGIWWYHVFFNYIIASYHMFLHYIIFYHSKLYCIALYCSVILDHIILYHILLCVLLHISENYIF